MKRVLFSFVVVVAMLGCGSGNGENTDQTVAKNSYEQQNKYAEESFSHSYEFFEALDESNELVKNVLGDDWIDTEWTEDDIETMLSENEIETLSDQLITIFTDKVIPSAEKAETAINALVNSSPNNLQKASIFSKKIVTMEPVALAGAVTAATITAIIAFTLKAIHEGLKFKAAAEKMTPVEKIVDATGVLYRANKVAKESGKAAVLSARDSVVFNGLQAAAQAKKLHTLKTALSTASDLNDGAGIFLGINECKAEASSNKQNLLSQSIEIEIIPVDNTDESIHNSDEEVLNNNTEISYMGKSDSDGTFYNIPEGEWSFYAYKDGHVPTPVGCVTVNDNTDEVSVNMTPIDSTKDDGNSDFTTLLPQNGLNLTINIPGYTGEFEPAIAGFTAGPIIVAGSANPLTEDHFTMFFQDPELSSNGTYPITNASTGNTRFVFHSPQITHEDTEAPVFFYTQSGSVSLIEYGSNRGEKLSGSFTAQVEGEQRICMDVNCNNTQYQTITGTMSGTFNSILY
ncbi:MAG: hypothetical protein K0U38_00820 [Epsilonproteobacteria bacterium]|nr:hypothetical protein [Campylobacterota bacterium]